MHESEKRRRLESLWERLQAKVPGLANGCKEALLGPHLEHPERSPIIVTTIPLEFASPSWFSLRQEGGGFKGFVWLPPKGGSVNPEARRQAEGLVADLKSELVLGLVQLRLILPHKQLAEWSWPLKEDNCH